MTQATEQKIRERAYEIWMATGCENGLADLHWLSAEQAVMDEAAEPAAKVAAKGSKARAGKLQSKAQGAASSLPATIAVRKRAAKKVVQA